MGGFSTRVIRAQAGRPLTVRLTSLDTRFHTDGGGKHQFAIDALGVSVIAPPKGTREATFTPTGRCLELADVHWTPPTGLFARWALTSDGVAGGLETPPPTAGPATGGAVRVAV